MTLRPAAQSARTLLRQQILARASASDGRVPERGPAGVDQTYGIIVEPWLRSCCLTDHRGIPFQYPWRPDANDRPFCVARALSSVPDWKRAYAGTCACGNLTFGTTSVGNSCNRVDHFDATHISLLPSAPDRDPFPSDFTCRLDISDSWNYAKLPVKARRSRCT